ncbi:DUF1566 domain-containing protein [Burkholderia lata]|uniref:DUF1566 domain-containing protein n=1 Tax=Burkholderia lata (strain ATCC 17760 / DSM 23089 / LMG 22485 / NCIMB 9086 / R18194 / 383) TaxID=482957 RepID=A0A6P2GW54_BURL3|nr:DUF1566 domain-containing protein [Burkholderia lata]VWB08030.1 hypothetical protein BLA6863_00197 [Burkholderia lata]
MGELIIPFHGGKLVVPHEEAAKAWLDKVLGAAGDASRTSAPTPKIGEYWDGQGGIYAGVMPIEDGSLAHRIVSADEGEDLQYGGYDHTVKGADSKIDGLANTIALNGDSADHPAAKWCSEYTKDGHSDFYLPAQRELSLAWATIAHVFGPHWYWSSTQSSASGAWGQYFLGGIQDDSFKTSYGRVRAFRRLNFNL